mgnify:CR=1 FL=1
MLSPPTPGIGGEVARSESKQGGAQGLRRAMQGRAARSAEVRKCGTLREHLPLMSQRCEATCKRVVLLFRVTLLSTLGPVERVVKPNEALHPRW